MFNKLIKKGDIIVYKAPMIEVTHLTSEDILTGSIENEDIWNDGKGDNATGDDEL